MRNPTRARMTLPHCNIMNQLCGFPTHGCFSHLLPCTSLASLTCSLRTCSTFVRRHTTPRHTPSLSSGRHPQSHPLDPLFLMQLYCSSLRRLSFVSSASCCTPHSISLAYYALHIPLHSLSFVPIRILSCTPLLHHTASHAPAHTLSDSIVERHSEQCW